MSSTRPLVSLALFFLSLGCLSLGLTPPALAQDASPTPAQGAGGSPRSPDPKAPDPKAPDPKTPDPKITSFLEEWSDAMKDVRTLRVRFKQIKELRILKKPLMRVGETLLSGRDVLMVVMGRDGKPETELLVTPGEARMHYPRLKRVEVFPLAEGAAPPTPFPLFGSDLERLPERYHLRLERDDSQRRVLILRPRDEKSPILETRMAFSDQPLKIALVEQRNRRGDKVKIVVSSFEKNVEIERKLELRPAPGTKTVRIDPSGKKAE